MSRTPIPEKCRKEIIARAAGRCEFKGCGEYLYVENLTGKKVNLSELAHIIADSDKGPRGDSKLSEELAKDVSNILLTCAKHHKLIDEKKEEYTVEKLRKMKLEHEEGIATYVKRIHTKPKTKILVYKSNIGPFKNIPIDIDDIYQSIEGYYPDGEHVNLSLGNYPFEDNELEYWQVTSKTLEKQFNDCVRDKMELCEANHLSVFALAPQPLLIKLGQLLTDITNVSVFQKHREPFTWKWQEQQDICYKIEIPKEIKKNIALVLGISFNINDDRIYDTLGKDTSIWKITVDNPNPNIIRCPEQLEEFRRMLPTIYDKIKTEHGEKNIINVFPAVPNSIAIEIGRVRLPKADLPLKIYDQNNGTFIETITI